MMRLLHLIGDKWQARGPHGSLVAITRRPTEGRHKNGGPRLGEMKRECLDARGMAQLLRELVHDMSDMFETAMCSKCGLLAVNDSVPPRLQRWAWGGGALLLLPLAVLVAVLTTTHGTLASVLCLATLWAWAFLQRAPDRAQGTSAHAAALVVLPR
jgi:hypothetical protein